MNILGFQISASELIAAFLFGVVGMYYFRIGKKESNHPVMLLGLALMFYPYFISGDLFTWVVGAGLWFAAYYKRNYM